MFSNPVNFYQLTFCSICLLYCFNEPLDLFCFFPPLRICWHVQVVMPVWGKGMGLAVHQEWISHVFTLQGSKVTWLIQVTRRPWKMQMLDQSVWSWARGSAFLISSTEWCWCCWSMHYTHSTKDKLQVTGEQQFSTFNVHCHHLGKCKKMLKAKSHHQRYWFNILGCSIFNLIYSILGWAQKF